MQQLSETENLETFTGRVLREQTSKQPRTGLPEYGRRSGQTKDDLANDINKKDLQDGYNMQRDKKIINDCNRCEKLVA